MKTYVILDTKSDLLLYGANGYTLQWDTEEEALRYARQIFVDDNYLIIKLKLRAE